MDLFRTHDLNVLLADRSGPCLTVMLPMERDGEANRIRWKNQLREAALLWEAQGQRPAEAKEFLAPLQALDNDPAFWQPTSAGLAAFLAPEFFRVYRLPLPVSQLTALSDRFQIKPLLPMTAADGAFYVLALSQNGVKLYHGTRWTVEPVTVKGLPKDLADALKFTDRDEPLNYHTQHAGATWTAIFHGQGVGIDDHKTDLLAYFRQIDAGLMHVLHDEHAPLAIATVAYLLPIYRHANHYPQLLEVPIKGNPDHLSARELHDLAYAMVRPVLDESRTRALAQYRAFEGTGRTSRDVAEILPAALRGDIATLFVPIDRTCWGRFQDGALSVHAARKAGDVDLYDLAAFETLKHGHMVHALPAAEVPGGTGFAAVGNLPMDKHGKRPGAHVVAV